MDLAGSGVKIAWKGDLIAESLPEIKSSRRISSEFPSNLH
jgi:hypothetical protein